MSLDSTARPLIALAGNPNTGKSTLFNRLTGSRVRVGNYPGVTTERRSGLLQIESYETLELLDIPGTYSLVARSTDEQVAIDAVLGLNGNSRPQVVVLCVDATQLLRNLYLTMQLQEIGLSVIVALTMVDEVGESLPDCTLLAQYLACPVIPIVASEGKGIPLLLAAIEECLKKPQPLPLWRWTPSAKLADAIQKVQTALPKNWPQSEALALWALMSIEHHDELAHIPTQLREAVLATDLDGREMDDEVVQARYRWLDKTIAPLVQESPKRSWTAHADRILIHPVYGFSIFILLMLLLFQSLFSWADPAIGAIEALFAWTGEILQNNLPASLWTELLVQGILGGVGSVVVFLPQILLLFFLLGLMEDSGYLARVAYLMDRIMRTMKLHGRAFVPMMSGFACAIPAIMATRTMERRRDRLLTMLVVPLMTCSARLPVYTLIIGALFPPVALFGFLPVQGLLMVAMYLFSIAVALVAAWILSRTVLRSQDVPFLLELPPYRLPKIPDVLRMMWEKSRFFLTEAGTVILVCTIILWFLLSFPKEINLSTDLADTHKQGEMLRQSYAGQLGRWIEPALQPLGFDWKIGIGLIGAFAAREVFVSTMGVVYNVGDQTDENSLTLREAMKSEMRKDGKPLYTPLVGLSLMVFFALACQCVSTLAVVKRETGGYGWPAFLFVYMTSLAWITSFFVYQGGRWLGFS